MPGGGLSVMSNISKEQRRCQMQFRVEVLQMQPISHTVIVEAPVKEPAKQAMQLNLF